MIKARIIAICSIGAVIGFACDPETPDDEGTRRGPLPEVVDEDGAELRVPATRAELAARGIEVIDVADVVATRIDGVTEPEAEEDDDDSPGPAADVDGITSLDDPRLTEPMRHDMGLVAEQHPDAAITVYTCPDNLQLNSTSFGGATAGWGSVGFVGGAISSTSILNWFTGAKMLKCHGERTITPGYSEPAYVSRMTAVGTACSQGSGGGDFWFTCYTVSDSNCCTTGHGAGCSVPPVQSCVCAADSYCCNNTWDSICVGEVTSVDCGRC